MKRLVTICIAVLCTLSVWGLQGYAADERIDDLGTQRFDWSRAASTPILTPTQLDSAIQSMMNQYHMNGVSAAVVVGDSIVWTGAYGYANALRTVPVTSSTLFRVASTSKSILTIGVLQLWEHGRLNLDANVNDYLPFTVRNPYYPDIPITVRMILAHTSTINSDDSIKMRCGVTYGIDNPVSNEDCLYYNLNPSGYNYLASNFLNVQPGTFGMYSSVGFALLGVVIEQITGMQLEQYFQDSVWAPLGMNETSWFLRYLDTNNIAQPCYFDGSAYRTNGHIGVAYYPSGQCRTSAPQLAHHLSAFLGRGKFKEVRILDSGTVDSMMVTQYPGTDPLYESGAFAQGISDYGLGWYHIYLDEPLWAWGHSGHIIPGTISHMYGVPSEHTGAIMLTNSDDDWDGIWNTYLLIWAFSRDKDQDGLIAGFDNCPADPLNDIDADGVCGDIDNCPTNYNPTQEDANSDGIGDACCCLGTVGNADGDSGDAVDLADLQIYIDYLFFAGAVAGCPDEFDVSGGDSTVDISDLQTVVDFLFFAGSLPNCP